ncbi:MAG: hypothetical protein EPN21_13250 [Methylococcaceae bacterium]|nr:MAG: hypothetical protein EPN21_13250 [Methylococcaceae bacterium]
MIDFAPMRQALLATDGTGFGGPATITVDGYQYPVTGIYTAPVMVGTLGGGGNRGRGVPTHSPDPTLQLATAEWVAVGGSDGVDVEVPDQGVFVVVQTRPDDGGMTTLTLRAFS